MTTGDALNALREIREQLSGDGDVRAAALKLADIVEWLLLHEQAGGLRQIHETRMTERPVIVGAGFLPQEVPPSEPERDVPQGPHAR